MSNEGYQITFKGIESVKKALEGIPNRLRRKLLRNALAAGGRVFRDEARRLTPVLASPVVLRGKGVVRMPGTLRKAIVVRTSRRAAKSGDVGVFVNVRPAKGHVRGARSPFDPYYWRFVDFGTVKFRGVRMFERSVGKAGEALRRIEKGLSKALARFNTPGGE